VVIHNGVDFDDLVGAGSYYTGASVQTYRPDFGHVHAAVKRLRDWPVVDGRPWTISVDEPGDAEYALVPDAVDPGHDLARTNGLWGALMAGAWGTEWYFGYANEHSDLTAQDWRSRDLFWDQARHALEFFALTDVPFHLASCSDELVNAEDPDQGNDAYVLAKPPDFYIVYAKRGDRPLALQLGNEPAVYEIRWFDPRNGGGLQRGSVARIVRAPHDQDRSSAARVALGQPLTDVEKDWVILVRKVD
jgi:hypothetical protein